MRKLLLVPILVFTQFGVSQNTAKTADLKSAEISNSTALSLLDNTSAVIISNPDCKDFSVNTENLSNISFDGTINQGKLSGLEYYGFGKTKEEIKQVTWNKFSSPTISGLLNKNDSIANFAVGISTNVVTIYRSKGQKMRDAYGVLRRAVDDLDDFANEIVRKAHPDLNPASDEYNKELQKTMDSLTTKLPDEFAADLKKPLLMFDIASAYSVLYPDNKYKTSTPDRLGFWGTITFSPKLQGEKNYLNLYVFGRYLDDKAVYDKVNDDYSDSFRYYDYGGKAQIDFNNVSVGYEYIVRNGDGKDYRSVGFVQYKLNTDVYLTGGFGKNFVSDSDKDLVTMFGIRWGINKKDKRDWQNE